jgi:2-desacetyl-2-hydroxyethyl bacteriochlorophyllide A dehydrogenase
LRIDAEAREARELWFLAPRVVELRGGRLLPTGPQQVQLRALASGVSQGTELLLYRGEGPEPFDPSLDAPGAPTYPRRYGYAWVGEVVERGSDVIDLAIGDRVFALAPHGDAHTLHAAAVRALPSAIPPSRAVLAANLETAITCVWDAEIALGDRVAVLGGGVVGLLVGWLAIASGAEVTLAEPSPRRRDAAHALGARALHPDDLPREAFADVVVEATGDPAALDRAIGLAAPEGTIAVASFYGRRTAPVALGSEFHRRRLQLRSTQVSTIPPSHAPRWSFGRRFDLVRRLLAEPILDALVGTVPFDRAPEVYAALDRAPGHAIQTVFVYG